MKSRETTSMTLIAFALCYVTIVCVLGGIDTLRNNGTDRIVNNEAELVLVTIPILFAFIWYLSLYSKDRFKSTKNDSRYE